MSWVESASSPCDLPREPMLINLSHALQQLPWNSYFSLNLCWQMKFDGAMQAVCLDTHILLPRASHLFCLSWVGSWAGSPSSAPTQKLLTPSTHGGGIVSRHVTPHSVKGFPHHLLLKSSHALANEKPPQQPERQAVEEGKNFSFWFFEWGTLHFLIFHWAPQIIALLAQLWPFYKLCIPWKVTSLIHVVSSPVNCGLCFLLCSWGQLKIILIGTHSSRRKLWFCLELILLTITSSSKSL